MKIIGTQIIGGIEFTKSIYQRLFQKVQKTESCWNWTGAIDKNGYGAITAGKMPSKVIGAHRVSWILEFGKIPDGMYVCHKCDNPSCVRPDHLFLGTAKDNCDDKFKKGRQSKRFKIEQRREIDKLVSNGVTKVKIAEIIGIHRRTVYRYINKTI